MSNRFRSRFFLSVLFSFLVFASSLSAQSLPAVAPPDSSAPASQATTPVEGLVEKPLATPALNKDEFFSKGFVKHLLSDQKTIWTSPAHIQKSDAKWLVPLAAGTTVLLFEDTKISHAFDGKTSVQNTAEKVGDIGGIATWGVPGAFLAFGKMKDNDRMVDTGERGLQAAIYSTIVMQVLKVATNRTRPYMGGNGSFFNGGDSFPSGHSMEAWALATVIAREYPHKPLVKYGMYSFATAVSLSRIANQHHYASDVLVGSSIGYLIGRFVTRNVQDYPVEAQ
jgi:hypothetical protein